MSVESLDYAFLRYLKVTAESEAPLHRFYLPYLADYPRVLELGSGMGGFVKLLREAGHDACGVDSDPGCIEASQQIDIPVVEADVLDYLRQLEPGTLDAIFSSHLVEHLPYETVLELIRLSHRALRPGGRLLLVTPNPRALISHLELYHLHFGHKAFYPAGLLAFFMDHCGFASTATGDNPVTAPSHLAPGTPWDRLRQHMSAAHLPPLVEATPAVLLPAPRDPLRRLIWSIKLRLIHWLVQPFTDRLNEQNRYLHQLAQHQTAALQQVDYLMGQPFESFAIGDKA